MDKKKEPPKIRVVVRKRPLGSKELQRNDRDILTVVGESSLMVQELKERVDLTKFIEEHSFTFDNVFEADQDNNTIYNECVLPLVSETFKGAKTTCFAYGQTGSGKSYSMVGYDENKGIVPIACNEIFKRISENTDENLKYEVQFSMLEIYNEKVQDLLANIKDRPKGGIKVRERQDG